MIARLRNRILARWLAMSVRDRVSKLIFVLLMATYAPFLNAAGDNAVSRLGLTMNFVQFGRLDITGYEHLTGDLARYKDGPYVSDKAPGMSILAIPAAFVVTRFVPTTPANIDSKPWRGFLIWVCSYTTSAVLTALAASWMFLYITRETGDSTGALVGSLGYALATPIFGWATAFVGHAAGSAALIIAFMAFDTAAKQRSAKSERLIAIGGLACAGSILLEYPNVIPAGLIFFYGLWSAFGQGRDAAVRFLIWAGGIGCLLGVLFLGYHLVVFGSPFTTAQHYNINYPAMRTSGYLGMTMPKPAVLWELLVGEHRGLLPVSPFAGLGLIALVVGLRHRDLRPYALLASVIVSSFLLANAAQHYWDGGWSTGPRYSISMMAFPALMVGLIWQRLTPNLQTAALIVTIISVFISWMCAAVTIVSPSDVPRALRDLIIPSFFGSELPGLLTYKATEIRTVLHHLPLIVTWSVLGWLIWKELTAAAAPNRVNS